MLRNVTDRKRNSWQNTKIVLQYKYKEVTKMYINKMIFMENDGTIDEIRKFGFPVYTDYGSYEITSQDVSDKVEELTNNEIDYDYTLQEFEDGMKNALGTDVYNMLLNDELDFVQVIY